MAITKIACVMVLCMVVVTPYVDVEGEVTCNGVVNNILPCLNYLRRGVGPDVRCCSGVKAINDLAKSTPDRQAACQCLKSAASSFGIGPTYSVGLPSACGVNLPFKTTPDIDCSKVR